MFPSLIIFWTWQTNQKIIIETETRLATHFLKHAQMVATDRQPWAHPKTLYRRNLDPTLPEVV
jgi:hypothetical protein